MTDPADTGRALTVDQDLTQGAEETDAADDRSRMTFLDHLDELRKRILYSLYAIIACCILTFYYWDTMFIYLAQYFQTQGGTLIFSKPMGAFLFSMKVGALAGLLIASPFVFTQFWLFVAPGLYAREKRVVIPFVILASALFGGGAAFAHMVAFPAMWKFFASYDGIGGLKFFPTIDDTFGFYVKTIIGLGLIFQMPILVYFLARFGVVTAKFLVKQIRYAILIIVISAAVITPSGDPVTLVIFAAPMLVLYIISIGVAWLFGKKREQI
jgi:sec-independent protein translocase protein TatC